MIELPVFVLGVKNFESFVLFHFPLFLVLVKIIEDGLSLLKKGF